MLMKLFVVFVSMIDSLNYNLINVSEKPIISIEINQEIHEKLLSIDNKLEKLLSMRLNQDEQVFQEFSHEFFRLIDVDMGNSSIVDINSLKNNHNKHVNSNIIRH